jgi:hypothetical protein
LLPATATSPQPVVAPLTPERFKIQFTISRDTHDLFRRVQALMRHSNPSGDPAVIFDRGLTLLLADLARKKFAHTDQPRSASGVTPRSRHIPATVKREVWTRDGGCCAFVGSNGRCTERAFLEFHHLVPFADDGPPTTANIALRCRPHNAYDAMLYFGSDASDDSSHADLT